ncbi:MAG: hypothetical protein EOP83_04250 [Verrucomicrobiaceae bacterium]|nr:MAG: hypothetical protein EOP83_04250 [Verrucomicrobiaceae bacterium]
MMTRTRFIACLSFALMATLSAAAAPPEEEKKIEGLIAHVGSLKKAVFIRNGKEYDAASAAKFLKGKWEAQGKGIKTAAEFIEKVATKSSTSGKAYRIRLEDGKETDCGPYLTEQLKKG